MSELNPFASPADRAAPDRPVPVLSPPQTVKYQLSEADLIATTLFTARSVPEVVATHTRQRRRQVIVGLVMLGVAGLFAATDGGVLNGMVIALVAMGGTMMVMSVFYPLVMRRTLKSRVHQWIKQGVLPLPDETVACTIDHAGVAYAKPHVQMLIEWPAISRVRNTPDHLFIYHQPSAPIIAPSRAFVTEEGFQAFCNLAQRLWEEHHEPRDA